MSQHTTPQNGAQNGPQNGTQTDPAATNVPPDVPAGVAAEIPVNVGQGSAPEPPPLVATDLPVDPQAAAESLVGWLQGLWVILITPGWRQYQIIILMGLVVVSVVLRLATRGRIDAWMRSREGVPKWQLRLLIQLRDRLVLIYFVILSWGLYWVMQQLTWPSRSRIIGIFATMAFAWLVIGLGSRLVRNRTLRRIVEWSLWAYATLVALGLLDEAVVFLDSMAVSIGTFRLTALVLIKAVLLIAALLNRHLHGDLGQKGDVEGIGQCLATTTAEQGISPIGLVGRNERAHVFDHTQHRDAHLAEHGQSASCILKGHLLWGGHDHYARHRNGLG